MALDTPPRLPPLADGDIEGGVIEDARARQRSHRRVAILLLFAVIVGALILSFNGGGGSDVGGVRGGSSGSGGGAGHGAASAAFDGAPTTQRDGYGVTDRACPLAPPNRYLPPRAGCVEVKRADLTGDGQQDLVIVYSVLSRRHPWWYDGPVPAEIAHDFVPEHPYLKVVFPSGKSATALIRGPRGTYASAIDFLSEVGQLAGDEIFVEATREVGGGADVVYGLRHNRLVAAGPTLVYGGDSGYRAGFTCVRRGAPGVIERTFALTGPTIYGAWKETETTYSWQGARLAQTSQRTFTEHGQPSRADSAAGTDCGPLVKDD